jgi:hypothetical protein
MRAAESHQGEKTGRPRKAHWSTHLSLQPARPLLTSPPLPAPPPKALLPTLAAAALLACKSAVSAARPGPAVVEGWAGSQLVSGMEAEERRERGRAPPRARACESSPYFQTDGAAPALTTLSLHSPPPPFP